MGQKIYLDYNATTPMRPEVLALMAQHLDTPYNASSIHSYGREGRKIIDKARRQIASAVGCDPNNVIFNSGATEGNNTVLKYFQGQTIAVSAIEHPSVLEARPDAIIIPVSSKGIIDLDTLDHICKEHRPAVVSCMMVNNETGIIQPITEASSITKRYGSYFHCDGVQAFGKLSFSLFDYGIDFLTLSAHKIGGPQGVGALVLGLCGETPTLLDGGGQEKKARAGTENVAGIAGFGLAAEMAQIQLNEYGKLDRLRNLLEAGLKDINKDILVVGETSRRVANTSLFSLPDIRSESILMALDLEGIAASNGSACSSGTVQESHVIKAMKITDKYKNGALRISMGWGTKPADIEQFLKVFKKIVDRV